MRFMELVPSADSHGLRRQPRGSDSRPVHVSLDGTKAAAWVAHRHAFTLPCCHKGLTLGKAQV